MFVSFFASKNGSSVAQKKTRFTPFQRERSSLAQSQCRHEIEFIERIIRCGGLSLTEVSCCRCDAPKTLTDAVPTHFRWCRRSVAAPCETPAGHVSRPDQAGLAVRKCIETGFLPQWHGMMAVNPSTAAHKELRAPNIREGRSTVLPAF